MDRNLKKQLIKIGNENPRLRGDVRRILKASDEHGEHWSDSEEYKKLESKMERLGFSRYGSGYSFKLFGDALDLYVWVNKDGSMELVIENGNGAQDLISIKFGGTTLKDIEKKEKRRAKIIQKELQIAKQVPKRWK